MREHIVTRFWAKVDQSAGPNECWPWTAATMWNGYGVFRWEDNKTVGAHRVAYIIARGPIPAGLHIDHECHNGTDCKGGPSCLHRLCVNPAHLAAKTRLENVRASHVIVATHCTNGHEYTPQTVYIWPKNGQRYCRICQRAIDAKRSDRRKAARRTAKQLAQESA